MEFTSRNVVTVSFLFPRNNKVNEGNDVSDILYVICGPEHGAGLLCSWWGILVHPVLACGSCDGAHSLPVLIDNLLLRSRSTIKHKFNWGRGCGGWRRRHMAAWSQVGGGGRSC